MEGVGRGREAGMLRDFAVQHRWELLLLEDAYTQGRYGLPSYTIAEAEKGVEAASRLIELLKSILGGGIGLDARLDMLMARWFYELQSTWRKAAATVARVVKQFYPEARVYVIGGAAEDRLTAVSDLDILVVLPWEPSPRERLEAKKRILLRAFEEGLPWDYPVDLHVTGPKGFQQYKRYTRKMIEIG